MIVLAVEPVNIATKRSACTNTIYLISSELYISLPYTVLSDTVCLAVSNFSEVCRYARIRFPLERHSVRRTQPLEGVDANMILAANIGKDE